MRNKFFAFLLVFVMFTGCSECNHEYSEATCTAPSTCALCGMTQGEQSEHTLAEATFEQPATCTVCGFTDGVAKQPYWVEKNIPGVIAELNTPYDIFFVDKATDTQYPATITFTNISRSPSQEYPGYDSVQVYANVAKPSRPDVGGSYRWFFADYNNPPADDEIIENSLDESGTIWYYDDAQQCTYGNFAVNMLVPTGDNNYVTGFHPAIGEFYEDFDPERDIHEGAVFIKIQ